MRAEFAETEKIFNISLKIAMKAKAKLEVNYFSIEMSAKFTFSTVTVKIASDLLMILLPQWKQILSYSKNQSL
jgi:hypothetical protein